MNMQGTGTRHDGPFILAVDLDGTFLPLPGNQRNRADLDRLVQGLVARDVMLVYVTGRHFESVAAARVEFDLPNPRYIICDVGTTIFRHGGSDQFELAEDYRDHLADVVAGMPAKMLRERLESINAILPQEPEKQGLFKVSYYADASRLSHSTAIIRQQLEQLRAPYSIIHSVDPFNGKGLIDLLPETCSKAYALNWLIREINCRAEDVIYAGDSGNDFEALTAGYHSIVVGNADRQLARQVYQEHRQRRTHHKLYMACHDATSGVLEGCEWFGMIDKKHRMDSLGAVPVKHQATHFRVWAPETSSVEIELLTSDRNRRCVALSRENQDYFSGVVSEVRPGTAYKFNLDGGEPLPDPASRFQPDGVDGFSSVVDHQAFAWTDENWQGVSQRDLIIYELHVGTFTEEGTFLAAIDRLPGLVELGITAIELMPVTQSAGRWNWGYDGVNLFAVRNTYGEPNDFKAFVDRCHALGLAVILDVVYNHIGPEGNHLDKFAPYFSQKHHTPWGDAFNFDEAHCEHVRRLIVENAIYWLDEYHLDGLRLDAVHFMLDESERSILGEIRSAIGKFGSEVARQIHVFAETNVFDNDLLNPADADGYDGIWCDCLMHAIYSHASLDLQLTDRDYRGAADIVTALRRGYVYHGKTNQQVFRDDHRDQMAAQLSSLVVALQNHDAVGSHPLGHRLHHLTSTEFQKSAATLVLLHPGTPLIFMGEEVAAESPFPFFADFENPQLRSAVIRGRKRESAAHLSKGEFLSPFDSRCFYDAKLGEALVGHEDVFQWYRDLIRLRKTGQSEGWLSQDHMDVDYDPTNHTFVLRFDGTNVHVTAYVRLSPIGTSNLPAMHVDLGPNEIVLSSMALPEHHTTTVDMQMNHALVVAHRLQ